LIQFWYAWFSGFSAITAFDQYFITLYNIVFTSFPVLIVGIFDQDVNDKVSIEHPGLYTPGQQSKYFNKKIFLFQIFKATLTSAFIFFIGYGAFQGLNMHPGTGKDASDYQTFATCLETSLVFIVSLQMALDTQYWTAINHFFLWGSIAMFFLFLFMMYSNTLYSILPNTFFFVGAARNSYAVPTLWFTVLLTVAICILPVLGWRYYLQLVNPSLSYQARMGYRDYKTGKEQPPIGLETEFSRNNIERRSNTHMQRTLTRQSQRRQAGQESGGQETGEQMGRLIMDGTVRRSTRRKKN
jgi:phospholipid-translocating ATPase